MKSNIDADVASGQRVIRAHLVQPLVLLLLVIYLAHARGEVPETHVGVLGLGEHTQTLSIYTLAGAYPPAMVTLLEHTGRLFHIKGPYFTTRCDVDLPLQVITKKNL